MGKRDWGGTVLVACLIALAGLPRAPIVLLALGAVAGAAVVVWDVRKARLRRAPYDHKGRPSLVEELSPAERERILRRGGEAHAELGDAPAVPAQGSAASRQRGLIERGEDLKRKVGMERIMIERTGRQLAQEHMLGEWTDSARSWGADAGLATEPPPIGFYPTGQPAAQRKTLEGWIGTCLDSLKVDS